MPIAIGKTITATTTVNMRRGAGMDYIPVGTLAPNQSALVVGGPQVHNGLTWWQIDGGKWVAEAYAGRALIVAEGESNHTLIAEMAQRYNVGERRIAAVIQVESGGRGFDDGRLIIRFEPHVFASLVDTAISDFFKVGTPAWNGNQHLMRPSQDAEWKAFHGSQDREWLALALASMIDAEAAWASCSMGAPQIMGFHYKALGYASARDMARAFAHGESVQIVAMLAWMESSGALEALRDGDYVRFATIYNGPGQAHYYAQLLRDIAK